jgi:hypothetical protein
MCQSILHLQSLKIKIPFNTCKIQVLDAHLFQLVFKKSQGRQRIRY